MRWTLLFVSLLTVAAYAGTDQPCPKQGRAPLDADGDDFVSRTEAEGHPRLAGSFDAADTNKDGQLDAAELEALRSKMRAEWHGKGESRWKAADTDGDGALSRAEAEQSMPRIAQQFDQLDANGDGLISRDEMHAYRMSNQKGP